MSEIKFTDGININTDGPYRAICLPDGWYVIGQRMMIPVKHHTEALEVIKEMNDSMKAAILGTEEK